MKTILAVTIAAATVATLSFGAMAAPMVTVKTKAPVVVVHKHHAHKVCKTVWHHHKKSTVCAWVK